MMGAICHGKLLLTDRGSDASSHEARGRVCGNNFVQLDYIVQRKVGYV